MTEEEYERLEKLERQYTYAQGICDPIDFAQRQKNLVYFLCEYLLKPLDEERKKRSESEKES